MSYIQYPHIGDFGLPQYEPPMYPTLAPQITPDMTVVTSTPFENYDKLIKLLEEKIDTLEEALYDSEMDIIELKEKLVSAEEEIDVLEEAIYDF